MRVGEVWKLNGGVDFLYASFRVRIVQIKEAHVGVVLYDYNFREHLTESEIESEEMELSWEDWHVEGPIHDIKRDYFLSHYSKDYTVSV